MATFADVSWAETAEPASLHVDADDDERLLAALVDEMLCLLHVLGVVPVDGAVLETEDGGLAGCFDVAAVGHVGLVGPLPRAVVNHQVERGSDDASWRCQVTVKKQVTLPP